MENTTQSRYCPIVFVLGLPGSGKGTLCKLVADQSDISGHRYCHISTGDYLRELCKSEVSDDTLSFDLNRIRKHLRESKLLPSHVLVPVLEHKISSIPKESNATTTWLIDGFPRNMETALVFEEKIGKPVKVIVLECARDVAQHRFLSRGRERSDDEKLFTRRYEEYVENMKAIREHYGSALESICVDGTREESLAEFIRVLPQN